MEILKDMFEQNMSNQE